MSDPTRFVLAMLVLLNVLAGVEAVGRIPVIQTPAATCLPQSRATERRQTAEPDRPTTQTTSVVIRVIQQPPRCADAIRHRSRGPPPV